MPPDVGSGQGASIISVRHWGAIDAAPRPAHNTSKCDNKFFFGL